MLTKALMCDTINNQIKREWMKMKITCREYVEKAWDLGEDMSAMDVLQCFRDRHTLNGDKIEDWHHTAEELGEYKFHLVDIENIEIKY